MEAYLDIAILKCPHCGAHFAESSWYAVEMESDLDCGKCSKTFNTKQNLKDRILAKFELDKDGKVKNASFERQK